MLKRVLVLVACLSILAFAGSAWAQEQATLLMKSGQRVTGDLVDMNSTAFTVRVNGNDQTYPIGDVAVIDFTGNARNLPSAEASAVATGQPGLVVLRNGQTIDGRLADVGGTTPLRLKVETSSGQQNLESSQVARIYLASPPNEAVATTGLATPVQQAPVAGARRVAVAATQPWTATGLTVRKGQFVSFSSDGQIQLSTDPNDIARPAGALSGRTAPRAVLPGTLAGALIGRINNGQPFGIGNQTAVPMPETGQLYLGINDDNFSDNSGQYVVTLTLQRTAVPRR